MTHRTSFHHQSAGWMLNFHFWRWILTVIFVAKLTDINRHLSCKFLVYITSYRWRDDNDNTIGKCLYSWGPGQEEVSLWHVTEPCPPFGGAPALFFHRQPCKLASSSPPALQIPVAEIPGVAGREGWKTATAGRVEKPEQRREREKTQTDTFAQRQRPQSLG